MGTAAIILAIIVLSVVTLAIVRSRKVKAQSSSVNQKQFDRIQPLQAMLASGQPVSGDDVFPFAKNVQTRQACFQLLSEAGRTDLFPQQYFSILKSAESNLVNWLEFPTELDACPDDIEHIRRVTIDFDGQNNLVHYEVFKCRVNAPHWASKDGWFIGVVGPYFDDSKPYDFPHATFSRISSSVDKHTPEEEAKWVHENISMRR